MTIKTVALSDVGGRRNNQDAFDYVEPGTLDASGAGCWAIADGLGGHGGGEEASRLAVHAALEAFKEKPMLAPDTLARCIHRAQRAIHDRRSSDERLQHMRTTLVVLIVEEGHAIWAHIGDSRLYHFRTDPDTKTIRLRRTKDHSVPQVLAEAGEITQMEIRDHEDRNRLLQSLGGDEELRPSIEPRPIPIHTGDAFLLCTDGFWEYLSDLEMYVELVKAQLPDDWLRNLMLRFEDKTVERNDHDNYSAIAIFAT